LRFAIEARAPDERVQETGFAALRLMGALDDHAQAAESNERRSILRAAKK